MDHDLRLIEQHVRDLTATDPAHDFQHIRRVVTNATLFAHGENASLEVVLPAAWLHDCVTLPKNAPNRDQASRAAAVAAVEYLVQIDYPERWHDAIAHAIEAHSYSAGIAPKTLEAKVVQDADRIDALGAIGVARCFAVGGALSSQLYEGEDPFADHRELDDRRYCVDHFYTKLLTLEEQMNTGSARAEAHRRTRFLHGFLEQLRSEIVLEGDF